MFSPYLKCLFMLNLKQLSDLVQSIVSKLKLNGIQRGNKCYYLTMVNIVLKLCYVYINSNQGNLGYYWMLKVKFLGRHFFYLSNSLFPTWYSCFLEALLNITHVVFRRYLKFHTIRKHSGLRDMKNFQMKQK